MHRRHALHIAVVLSKAALSGPSVCLRARAPLPTSRHLSADRPPGPRRAAKAAGLRSGGSLGQDTLVCEVPLDVRRSRHTNKRRD